MKTNLLLVLLLIIGFSTSRAQVNNGLVAKYSFNNGNANDEIGSNHGTVNGASLTSDRFGNPNMAYDFDGVDDFISLPSDVYFNGAFSVSAWANIRTIQSWSRLLDFGNGDNSDNVLLAFSGATSGNFVAEVIGGGQLYSSSLYPLNSWSFVCITLNADSVLSIYLNNTLSGSMQVSLMPQNITRTLNYIGKSNWSFDAYTDGKIDDLRIYNRALNLAEIDSLFNEPNPMATGIEEARLNQNSINLYPNPTGSQVQFSMPVNVQLYNLAGQVLIEEKHTNSLDLSKQGAGVYFVVFLDDEQRVLQRSKLIKQ